VSGFEKEFSSLFHFVPVAYYCPSSNFHIFSAFWERALGHFASMHPVRLWVWLFSLLVLVKNLPNLLDVSLLLGNPKPEELQDLMVPGHTFVQEYLLGICQILSMPATPSSG
jgi:hypothetical protein